MENKTKESNSKSTDELAAEWFSSKSYLEQHELSDKYFESRNPSLLTIKQVEEIWLKETEHGKQVANFKEFMKPNQKQFKEFNPELFDSYCMKFNDKDKLQLAEIAINNCKMSFEDSAKIIEIIRKYR